MNHRTVVACLLAISLTPAIAVAGGGQKFTDEFGIESCTFKSSGTNPYFMLKPGRQLRYSNAACVANGDCDELEELVITVLFEERDITFKSDDEQLMTVRTRVVEERETADGQLKEISRNYFAECEGTGDVFYFGEDVDIYENGKVVSHDGAWLAGKRQAQPGIIMPGGAFLLGARYYQELAPNIALDRAEHVRMDLEVKVPAGQFEDCVRIHETTPLEPTDLSKKTYCPETGLIIDGDLQLVSVVE